MFCSVWIVKLQENVMAIVCCVIAIRFFARYKSIVFLLEGGNENIQFGPIKLAVLTIV